MENSNKIDIIQLPQLEITYEPLIIPHFDDYSKITNILLIDSMVQQYQIFSSSVCEQTLPIIYSHNSNRQDLLDFLKLNFLDKKINRLCFVFDDSNITFKKFMNGELFFTNDDTIGLLEYSTNCKFIIDLINQFDITNTDYLVCNSLTYSSWKSYYGILQTQTKTIVGASSDQTGNIKYGGDWDMQSQFNIIIKLI